MELSFNELVNETKNTYQFYSWQQLIQYTEDSRNKFFKFLHFLKENDNKKEYGFKRSPYEKHNPLIWEAVHPIFLWKNIVQDI